MANVFSRAYYRSSMLETMVELFNFYHENYNATVSGCREIITTWKYNKGDMLDERFKNIPGFNAEQHHIKLSNPLFRELDPSGVRRFFDNLPVYCKEEQRYEGKTIAQWQYEKDSLYSILHNVKSLPLTLINYHELVGMQERYKVAQEMVSKYYWEPTFTKESVAEYDKRCDFVSFMREKCQQFVDEEIANYVNNAYPDVHAHVGQKMSRMVRKWCELLGFHKKDEYFENKYAQYANAINPIVLNETLIISWNPLDYLTMSFGPTWTSCHSIDKDNIHNYDHDRGEYGGCYSSGPLSYMLDGTSIVVYSVSKRDDDGEDPEWNLNKVHRQMFHVDFNTGKLIVQGRLYPDDQCDAEDGEDIDPQNYKQYREIIQSVIAQAFDIPNLWQKNQRGRTACSNVTYSYGTHYRDYLHYSNCNVSFHQSDDLPDSIIVGHSPICPSCGNEHSEEKWSTCEDCRHEGRECEDCGYTYNENDMHWVEGYGYCCENCCSYCEYHGEWERSDMTYINDYGNVCEWGIDDMLADGDLYACDECGSYVYYTRAYKAVDNTTGEMAYFCSSRCLNRYLEEHEGWSEAV